MLLLVKRLQNPISIETKRSYKEFHKFIHPDLMQKAPLQVKEENQRSLKMLNDYLDNLKQNKGAKQIKLKFYAPEKQNEKSKKFLFFETKLDPVPPSLSEEMISVHYDKAITLLANNLKAVQISASEKVLKNLQIEVNAEAPEEE